MIYVRDRVCITLATYEDNNGNSYYFYPPFDYGAPEDNKEAIKEYEKRFKESLLTVNPKDTATIREIYNILTPPQYIIQNGIKKSFIAGQMENTPLIAVVSIIQAIRSDLILVENLAVNHLAQRPNFLSKDSELYLNKLGDSLNKKE